MKVIYIKTFPVGNIYWEKIGVEIETSEENARKTLYEAKKTVENFHYESNKASEKQENIEVKPSGSIEEDIKSCTTLKVLESYRFVVKNKPELQPAYDKKYEELKNNIK
jgi:hypothetical protein